MEHKAYKSINKSVRKKDSMQLLLGKPVYTDDVTPDGALVVKILRSPHANAIVEEINTAVAKKVPGVVDIYTWEDRPPGGGLVPALRGGRRSQAQHGRLRR